MKNFKEYYYPKKKDYIKKEQEVVDGPQPHWDRWEIQEWKKKWRKKKKAKK